MSTVSFLPCSYSCQFNDVLSAEYVIGRMVMNDGIFLSVLFFMQENLKKNMIFAARTFEEKCTFQAEKMEI